MPLVFTKPQIRRYLAEMGYEDVEDEQLNDFIKDLEHLIKHDEKKKQKAQKLSQDARAPGQDAHAQTSSRSGHRHHHHGRHSDYLNDRTGTGGISSDSGGSIHSLNASAEDLVHASARRSGGRAPMRTSNDTDGREEPDSKAYHHSHRHHGSRSGNEYGGTNGTDRERAQNDHYAPRETGMTRASAGRQPRDARDGRGERMESDADSHHSRRIRRSHDDNEYRGTTSAAGRKSGRPDNNEELENGMNSLRLQRTASSSGSRSSSLPSTISTLSVDSTSSSQESDERKSKFNIPDSVKTDPVALYHYYNSYWTKHKIPGTDSHKRLRWNVRAGTMGRIPCTPCGERVNYLRR